MRCQRNWERVYSLPMTKQSPRRSAGPLPRGWILPIVVLATTLLLYLPFRSLGLDDFDSYSFALALEHFDLTLQQPQPPGFPVYVALARALTAVSPSEVAALTWLSALGGTMATFLVCRLGQMFDPDRPLTAAFGALLFALIPMSWLTSEKALSDMPGLAITLLSLWRWVAWRTRQITLSRPTPPIAAALVTGLAFGVRPQNALPVGLLVLAIFIDDLVHRRSLKVWIGATVLVIAGSLVWLIPTAGATGGLSAYIDHIRAHATHVGRADSLLGMAESIPQALRIRLFAFGDTLLTSLIGVGVTPPFPPGTSWRYVGLALVVLPGLIYADWQRPRTRWLGLWALTIALQILVIEALDRPRLLLPLIPPLALLIASGWARIGNRPLAGTATMLVTSLALLTQTVPWVTSLSQTLAPPAQAAAYIRGHYPASETLVAAAGSFRAAQVELPDYPLAYLYTFNPEAVTAALASGYSYVAVLDRDQFTTEAMATLTREGTLVVLDDLTFSRDRRIHTQHDQVRVQILTPSELVSPEALDLPPDGCIDLGSDADGRYLGQGWFRSEEIAGTTARWAGTKLTSTVRLTLPSADAQTLHLRALAYPADQILTLSAGGHVIGRASLPQSWTDVQIEIPQEILQRGSILTLELIHATTASPFETTGGASSDRRALAAAYDLICVTASGGASGSD